MKSPREGVTWGQFRASSPGLAAAGERRLTSSPGPAFLATVRADESPRVHPVTPLIAGEHLVVYMHPISPKGRDIRCDGRYALHSHVADHDGTGGEFAIRGAAMRVEGTRRARLITESGRPHRAGYERYELLVVSALGVSYDAHEVPSYERWPT